MTKYLSTKVPIPRWCIWTFSIALIVIGGFSIFSFIRIGTITQEMQQAQTMAFLQTIDFKGQSTAPANLSEMPDFLQMEVKSLLEAQYPDAFVVKK